MVAIAEPESLISTKSTGEAFCPKCPKCQDPTDRCTNSRHVNHAGEPRHPLCRRCRHCWERGVHIEDATYSPPKEKNPHDEPKRH